MEDPSLLFIAFGAVFLAGLAADVIGQRTRLPRVTLLLLCGMAVGQAGLDILPDGLTGLYEAVSVIALTMVAFLLGGSLTKRTILTHGRAIMALSGSVVVFTVIAVTGGLWLMGMELAAALLMGGIATATDPAATEDALRQSGAKGAFADRLRGIVAIDDAWGIIAFGLLLVLANVLGGAGAGHGLKEALREIGGGVALGLAIGVPAAVLTGRISGGDPLRSEALGVVFLTAGLALMAEVSYLLAGMTAGMVVANLARHHTRAFHEIEHIEWPFMILFFVLAGAEFVPASLVAAGALGVGFIALRILGRIVGGWLAGWLVGLPGREARWTGPALLPQAGIAIGMGLVAAEALPAQAEIILSITVGTTILFEIAGPWLTGLASRRAAEAPQG